LPTCSGDFLLLAGFFTFTFGGFSSGARPPRGLLQLAALAVPVLVPAAGMRLVVGGAAPGTIELLLTMPVAAWQAIVGKFLASWLF